MCTILIADDDKNLRYNLKSFLLGEGFSVLLAKNGLEAFKLASDNLPDLILSDINMPYMDGMELLCRLKKNVDTVSIPVIFISASVEEQSVKMALDNGAVEYIKKPFNLSDLLNVINFNKTHNNHK